MSLFMNNRLIVSKQYHRAFWLSKYCIASILFRVCRLLELDSGKLFSGCNRYSFPVWRSVFPLRPLCVFDYNENCCQNDVTTSGRPLRVKRLDFFNRELRILCHDFIRHTICQHRAGGLNRLFTLAFFSHFFKSSAHSFHSHLHNS